MNAILIKKFPVRAPFSVRRIPFLARFYRYAYDRQTTSRAEFWLSRALRKIFRVYRCLCGSSGGEFDYERLGRRAAFPKQL